MAGAYRVVVKLADRNGTGVSAELPFTKDQVPMSWRPADPADFHDQLLELH